MNKEEVFETVGDEATEESIYKLSNEINFLSSTYPDVDFRNLTSFVTELIQSCDNFILKCDNSNKLVNESKTEIECLVHKLEKEKEMRLKEINHSFVVQEAVIEDKLELKKVIEKLDKKIISTNALYNNLLVEYQNLNAKLIEQNSMNVSLNAKIKNLNDANASLKHKLEVLNNDLFTTKNTPWSKDKWLDDTVLNSYFEKMKTDTDIILLGPSLTQLLRFSDTTPPVNILDIVNFDKSKFVFCCVSNSNEPSKEDSGSHWSLLFFDKRTCKAYHFDSLAGTNYTSATKIAENLGISQGHVFQPNCYQQTNSFECGINVIVNTKFILQHYCSTDRVNTPFLDWYNTCGTYNIAPKACTVPLSFSTTANMSQANKWVTVKSKSHSVKKQNVPRSFISQNKFEVLDNVTDCSNLQSSINTSTTNSAITKGNTSQSRKTSFKNKNVFHGRFKRNNKTHKVTWNVNNSNVTSPVKVNLECSNVNVNLPPKTKTCVQNKEKVKVRILSDSHGRHLSELVLNKCSEKLNVCGLVKPNGKLSQVVEGVESYIKDMGTDDVLIVFGGTNDVNSGPCDNNILEQIKSLLLKVSKSKLFIVALPLRRDKPHLNNYISSVNKEISLAVSLTSNAKFISLSSISRQCFYTKFGLHFNMSGKRRIADLIIDHILPSSGSDQIHQIPVHISASRIKTHITSKYKNNIQVRSNIQDHFLGLDSKTLHRPHRI